MSARTASLNVRRIAICIAVLGMSACGGASRQPPSAGFGPDPSLPEPAPRLLPIVSIAPAKGWAEGQMPAAADGLTVNAFARGLDHPRWLLVLPNGDVLVAESNAPAHPDAGFDLKNWIASKIMARAGAGVPSPDRITLLRDSDGDGVADLRSVLLSGLHSPFGMALVGEQLFVANTDAVLRFPYPRDALTIGTAGDVIATLPAGAVNYHWTRNLIASPNGSRLYVTVGSNSNVADHGIEQETGRAAIWEINLANGAHRIFASGLRNPNGLAWQPDTGALWTAVNERDEIGNDLVPDYMTSVRDGGFYGWPYSYYGDHVDVRVTPPRPELVATAIAPDYALGAHTASLGLTAARGTALPERLRSGMFIGQHGSWNRKPLSGYKVIFVPFTAGKPAASPVDVLTGFVDADGKALGRPVGVAIDAGGALLVADDVGNAVWRVTARP